MSILPVCKTDEILELINENVIKCDICGEKIYKEKIFKCKIKNGNIKEKYIIEEDKMFRYYKENAIASNRLCEDCYVTKKCEDYQKECEIEKQKLSELENKFELHKKKIENNFVKSEYFTYTGIVKLYIDKKSGYMYCIELLNGEKYLYKGKSFFTNVTIPYEDDTIERFLINIKEIKNKIEQFEEYLKENIPTIENKERK